MKYSNILRETVKRASQHPNETEMVCSGGDTV